MVILFYYTVDLISGLASRIEFDGRTYHSEVITVAHQIVNLRSAVVTTEVDGPVVVGSELPAVRIGAIDVTGVDTVETSCLQLSNWARFYKTFHQKLCWRSRLIGRR